MIGLEEIRHYIVSESQAVDDENELDFDMNLFSLNILDSLQVLKLVTFLESKSGISIDLAEVDFEHFQTIRDIYAFLTSNLETA